ncbi:hypothetical protein PICSAR240_04232 [Mycobacterium avium subsp. paratuberculosis]|nr:hypothetical protein B0172_03422 [Mycobacterium avium subsp. paratuberculosis]OVF03553.1 hypothetical protein B0173_02057 [Mycobacterium avium subsp. paratuberculosis]CAG6919640.1 hypothetical protein PICSAR102_03662 [Mycobacterium avium subsp. paratuberculosis]CAG6928165.1 hypothetical protein PICSAR118_04100 [Mycobacterium avium subsp. paratuberculosis]CAG6928915.1 hypothetical protein PICSAR10_04008 [Mycobacterium avium subsp. paratuberculosis]
MVRHRGGHRLRLAGHRSRQPDALAARPAALLRGHARRAVPVAALTFSPGARRRAGDRRRDHTGRLRQHPQLRRRNADLPGRRPRRRPARHHHGARGIARQAGPPVPHRNDGHARRTRAGEHGAGQIHPRRVSGDQRLRRRRLRLPAAGGDLRRQRARCGSCGPVPNPRPGSARSPRRRRRRRGMPRAPRPRPSPARNPARRPACRRPGPSSRAAASPRP